ncbi:MAG: metal ABC transporter permease, partial [Shimia sp.]|nr:metal ABC transporter permease [Shimia sp.]
GLRHRRFQRRVHMRQGLLALAQGQPIYERFTLNLLRRAGLAHADGVATEDGKARAAKALRDEKRWEMVRADQAFESAAALYDGLREIETVLTADQITEIDRRMGGPTGVAP